MLAKCDPYHLQTREWGAPLICPVWLLATPGSHPGRSCLACMAPPEPPQVHSALPQSPMCQPVRVNMDMLLPIPKLRDPASASEDGSGSPLHVRPSYFPDGTPLTPTPGAPRVVAWGRSVLATYALPRNHNVLVNPC